MREETGVTLIIMALSMVVLIGLAALALDLSLAMNERRTAQNAADHAAMSASYARCTGGDPLAAGIAAAERNGYPASEVTLTNLGGNTFEARIATSSRTFFARAIGRDSVGIATRAVADCAEGAGSGNAIFAEGDSCTSYKKRQIDISGSSQTVYGGMHSNDNIHIGGSSNDFGPGNPPPTDSVTYVTSFHDGGSGNGFDPLYPEQVDGYPSGVSFDLARYDTGGEAAVAAGGQYYRLNGDIDGAFIEARGDGLYFATGDIKLDKTVDLDVTLVARGVVEISGSDQELNPFIDNLLIFGAEPYTGIDRCDKFVVSLSGSTQNWSGLIYGPNGLIEMNGSSNTALTGSLIGYAVRLNGSELTIIADPTLFEGESFVRLSE